MFGMKITQERLKEVLQYDENTGDFVWLRPTSNRVKAGAIATSKSSYGYGWISVDGQRYSAHRLAWLYVYGSMPRKNIDHIDNNRANNAIANLREATQEQNLFNMRISKKNTSGYKGVHFHRGTNKWRAVVSLNNKPKHLGLYKTPEEASAAYNDWCAANRGEFAWIQPCHSE